MYNERICGATATDDKHKMDCNLKKLASLFQVLSLRLEKITKPLYYKEVLCLSYMKYEVV